MRALISVLTLGSTLGLGACAGRFHVPDETNQLLVVISPAWDDPHARLQRFARDARGEWQAEGASVEVMLGRSGLGWGRGVAPAAKDLGGPEKREGDGRSPAGVFRLLEATGYAPEPPVGTTLAYRQATPELRCVDDPTSPSYNQLVMAPDGAPPPWSSDEQMLRDDDLYVRTIVVEHNRAPAVPGGGSCIFLHVWRGPGSPTVGCTAMEAPALGALLPWLEAGRRPLLVQLPAEVYSALQSRWKLPALPLN
jgi:L,D-peptidoglycan transpeptidase YkuD (ErfK/YbiS/YcfS/YnhG family)